MRLSKIVDENIFTSPMKSLRGLTLCAAGFALALALAGCGKKEEAKGPAEKAGAAMGQAIDKAAEQAGQAMEKAGEALKEAGEKVQEAYKDAAKK